MDLLSFIPIFIMSTVCGIAGAFRDYPNNTHNRLIERIFSHGIIGVIALLWLDGTQPQMDINLKYAIVLLLAYLGLDAFLELIEKIKGFNKKS